MFWILLETVCSCCDECASFYSLINFYIEDNKPFTVVEEKKNPSAKAKWCLKKPKSNKNKPQKTAQWRLAAVIELCHPKAGEEICTNLS